MPDDSEPPQPRHNAGLVPTVGVGRGVPPPPAGIIGYARARPEWSRHVHRLTGGVWYPVRERNPEAFRPEPLEEYVWVEVHARLEHIWLQHVEVQTGDVKPAT